MKGILLFWLLLFTSPVCQSVTLLLSTEDQEDFDELTAASSVYDIDQFSQKGFRREVVEIVLMHQALRLGGYEQPIKHKVEDVSYKRGIRAVETGDVDIWGVSVWGRSVVGDNLLLVSDPIVELGEYDAVMYTSAANSKALSVKTRGQLKDLSAVSNKTYEVDWATLSELNLRNLQHTPVWVSMVKFVHSGRADFMIAPLQLGKGFELTQRIFDKENHKETLRLVPIPNVKIYLNDSRHWIVSKQSKGSEEILDALNKGISILNESGKRHRALSECGFIKTELRNWTALN